MTVRPTTGRAVPERPALARLVGDPAAFAERSWGRVPLLHTAADGGRVTEGFTDLFGLDSVDDLVSVRGLRTPFLRLVKDGKTISERSYVGSGGVGAAVPDQARDDGIHAEVARGATLILQGLHRTWEPLLGFSQQLAADLGHPVQVNAYITPPQSQGFGSHYDVHDVFVLQVEGEKRWNIHAPVFPLPLRTQPGDDAAITRAASQEPLLDVVLRPGDCLYLPRGYLHSATALGGVSGHLTIGIHPWTRYHVLERVLEEVRLGLADDESLRASLPLGVDFADRPALTEVIADVRAAVQGALGSVDTGRIGARLVGADAATQRPAPVRPFAQLAAARNLTPDTAVVL
ncbi:MAG: cupin domain-containing protein, partial [Micrococcales bacterium]|nr:cupin domain-containing protein [Micrococcales bacterium]